MRLSGMVNGILSLEDIGVTSLTFGSRDVIDHVTIRLPMGEHALTTYTLGDIIQQHIDTQSM